MMLHFGQIREVMKVRGVTTSVTNNIVFECVFLKIYSNNFDHISNK